jgi:antitoxin (DNA-binding transcriptional repressor) of toxin-antitoxin stability system
MKTLTVREAREQMAHIEKLLATEGEVILTRRGKPIARIVSLTGGRPLPSRAALRAQTRQLRPTEALVREERDER